MKLGVIGFSHYLRRVYLPYLTQRADVELLAVCDILDPVELERLIVEARLASPPTCFRDMQTMLASVDLDAVIVSTPHVLHFSQVKACLETGRHVFVDKPLACQIEEAKILVALAESKGLKLAVGNQRRYEQPYQHVKETISQKRLGKIRLINYLFANSPWYDYNQSWRGDPFLSGGGALMDIGHLAVDMIIWLIEKPLRWIYTIADTPEDRRVEQSVVLLAGFDSDILVNMTISYDAPFPSVKEELSIYCVEGSICTRRVQSKRSPEPPMIIEQIPNKEARCLTFNERADNSKPLDDFLRGVLNDSSIVSGGKSNLPTVEFIDAAYRSIRENKKIEIVNGFFKNSRTAWQL